MAPTQVAPSKGWSNAGGPAASASATKTIGEVAAVDEDGPDWTFFTEWAGNVGIGAAAAGSGDGGGDVEDASASKGGDGGGGGGGSSGDTLLPPVWMENQPVSGVDMVALSDQSVPILFYDDVALYEDELHDFGYDFKTMHTTRQYTFKTFAPVHHVHDALTLACLTSYFTCNCAGT